MSTTLPLLAAAAIASNTHPGFTLTSSFEDGETLPMAQVATDAHGQNLSPEVTWQGAPEGTQSFAITMFDPDAPTGSGWWHWTVANIPPTATHIPQGGPLPHGAAEGRNDRGQQGYTGACPPVGHGKHRYQLTVWALKVPSITINAETPGAMVGFQLNANALASTTITGLWGR